MDLAPPSPLSSRPTAPGTNGGFREMKENDFAATRPGTLGEMTDEKEDQRARLQSCTDAEMQSKKSPLMARREILTDDRQAREIEVTDRGRRTERLSLQRSCRSEHQTRNGLVCMGPRDRDKEQAEGPTDSGIKSDTPQSTRKRGGKAAAPGGLNIGV